MSATDKAVSKQGQERKQMLIPPADIREYGNRYEVLIDLPGVAADALRVEVDRNELHVHGSPAMHFPEGSRRVHREYQIADFERSFLLPSEINREAISANMRHGVAQITLPKQQPQVQRISVNSDE